METYYGLIRSPADAIKLFEACRVGLLPRVQRRLSEKERQAIRPGSVFVWDEREAGMRRWTDGKSWSASRVSGSFLTYREMEGKRSSGFGAPIRRNNTGRTPESARTSDEDNDNNEPDGYRYKPDGLMKQSFSITAQNGQHLHLISYYTRPTSETLLTPTSDPGLRSVVPMKGMYPDTTWCESGSSAAMSKAPIAVHNYLQSRPVHTAYPQQYPPHHQYGQMPPSPVTTPTYQTYCNNQHPAPHQSRHQSHAPHPNQHPHYTTSPQYAHHPHALSPMHHAQPQYTGAPHGHSEYAPRAVPPEYISTSPRGSVSSYPAVSPRESLLPIPQESHRRPNQATLPPLSTLPGHPGGPAPLLTVSPVAPYSMPALSPKSARDNSFTPPRSAGSDHRSSLSSLLHPDDSHTLPPIKPANITGAAAHGEHTINLLNSKFRV